MPAKKKVVKAKSGSKAKAPAKRAKVVKKASRPKLKLVGKSPSKGKAKPEMKKKKSAPQAPNFFRQLLEARKKEREARQNSEHQHTEAQKDKRMLANDKHSRFGRYAGPRRRAA